MRIGLLFLEHLGDWVGMVYSQGMKGGVEVWERVEGMWSAPRFSVAVVNLKRTWGDGGVNVM